MVQDRITPAVDDTGAIRVSFLAGSRESLGLLALLCTSGIDPVALYIDSGLQEEDGVPETAGLTLDSPDALTSLEPPSLVLDPDDRLNHDICRVLNENGHLVVNSRAIGFALGLLTGTSAREREVMALNDMARIMDDTRPTRDHMQRIVESVGAAMQVPAVAIFEFNEVEERFVVVQSTGLGSDFCSRVRLSLSDLLVEEMLTFPHPLIISDLEQVVDSPLGGQAFKEGLRSLMAMTLKVKGKAIGFLCVFSRQSTVFNHGQMGMLATLSKQAGLIIENLKFWEETEGQRKLVEQLLARLVYAQEAERKRVAAEIHDSVAQTMVAALAQVQTCQGLLDSGRGDEIAGMLSALKGMLAENVREVRRIILDLRPSSLDDLGLAASLENMAARFRREFGLEVLLEFKAPEQKIPPPVETAVYRVVQEALQNARKHSGVGEARVLIAFEPKQVSIKIRDHGSGFDPVEVEEKIRQGSSQGIAGMRERILTLGGEFDVFAEPGRGTLISAIIPFARPRVLTDDISR